MAFDPQIKYGVEDLLPLFGEKVEGGGDASFTHGDMADWSLASVFLLCARETSLLGCLAPSSEKDINLPLFRLTYIQVNKQKAEGSSSWC